MPRKIRTVYFDFGNVISLPQNEDLRNELVAPFLRRGVPSTDFWIAYNRHRFEYDKDAIEITEYWRRVFSDLDLEPKDIDKQIELDDRSWTGTNEKTLSWARALKAGGFSIGVLSNMPGRFFREFIEPSSWIKDFDHIVISGLLSMIKPEPEIFHHAIRLCGAAAEEILYFDDLPHNVEAALSLGINARLFTSIDEIEEETFLDFGLPRPREVAN